MPKFLSIALFLAISGTALGTPRPIDGDSIRSSDHASAWSLPASSDALVGRMSTDTLTNKTMSGGSNTFNNIPLATAVTGTLGSGNLPADVDYIDVAQIITAAKTNSTAGAASTPALKFTGAPYTAGSATTNKPQVLVEWGGATSTNWSTAGTAFGINAAAAFTGDLISVGINGLPAFRLNYLGGAYFRNTVDNIFLGSINMIGSGNSDLVTYAWYSSSTSLTLWNKYFNNPAFGMNYLGEIEIGAGTFRSPDAQLIVRTNPNLVSGGATATSAPTVVIQSMTAQTGNLQEWQDSAATILSKIDITGKIFAPNIRDTALTTGIVKSNASGDLANAVSGTDFAPATSGSSIFYGNGSGGFSNVTVGSGLTFSGGTLSSTAGGGSVTSVAMTVPSWLSVAGSPITGSGTLAVTGVPQTANFFLAAPNGSSGAMTPRAIIAADIPILNQSTSGNAATATALASAPSACSAGQYVTQISVNGTPTCSTPVGGAAISILTKTSGYTVVTGDFNSNKMLLLEANCSAACTMTLPAASNSGYTLKIKNIGTVAPTIARAGSDTIDGDTSYIFTQQYQAAELIANGGTAWDIF